MNPLITVFTSTYNRAGLIGNLYDSLKKQVCKDFEWIVIDDDSADATDMLFKKIKNENKDFSVTYIKQPHGGKHRAINKGVKIARGKFFFIVDSDDYLLYYSIKKVKEWITDIEDKIDIAGVAGLRQGPDGNIVGEFPKRILKKFSYIDAKNTDRYLLKLMGDKAEVYKTEVLRKHPFPEFDHEYFVTESVCWNYLAKKGYKIRWYNVPIYVCEYRSEGLTRSGANRFKGHIENYQGYCYQVKNSLEQCHCYEAVTFFREYNNTALQLGKNIGKRAEDLGLSRFSYFLYYMIKMPVFYFYRMVIKVLRTIM